MPFAARVDFAESLKNSAVLWLIVLVLLLVAVFVIMWIRDRYRDREGHAASAHELLTQIGDLHREGDLTDNEFRSIKNRLVEQIDGSAPAGENTSPEKPLH